MQVLRVECSLRNGIFDEVNQNLSETTYVYGVEYMKTSMNVLYICIHLWFRLATAMIGMSDRQIMQNPVSTTQRTVEGYFQAGELRTIMYIRGQSSNPSALSSRSKNPVTQQKTEDII